MLTIPAENSPELLRAKMNTAFNLERIRRSPLTVFCRNVALSPDWLIKLPVARSPNDAAPTTMAVVTDATITSVSVDHACF